MLREIDNVLQNTPISNTYIPLHILSIPYNIVMDMNDVMRSGGEPRWCIFYLTPKGPGVF